MMLRIFSPIIFIFFCTFPIFLNPEVSAQDRRIVYSERAEQFFQSGLNAYIARNYTSALHEFDLILEIANVTQRTTAAYIMSGKSMIELGLNREAVRRMQVFLDRFPHSMYQDDAYFTLGVAYMRDRRYEDALYAFLRSIENTDKPELQGNAEAYLARIINNHITLQELQDIYDEARGAHARGFLALALAQRYIERGNVATARSVLEKAVDEHWHHPLIGQLRSLLSNVDEGITLKIGVILPLFTNQPDEPLRELGLELLQGIQFAIDEHNAQSDVKLYLDVRDSRRQPSVASRHVQELVNDNEVVAILGPVFSDEAFATAGVANARGVPIITPTATANHIADIGRYVFQTNPDYRIRGRAMARYAVERLGCKNLAVLAPVDSHGQDIAQGFIEEVNSLPGAYIVVNEWYRTGETNFRQQFYTIRSRGLQDSLHLYISFSGVIDQNDIMKLASQGVSLSLLDSLMHNESAVPVTSLLGPDGPRIADSLGINVITGDLYADSLEVPVHSIDAIFLPITSKDDMGIVSAQTVYYNVRTQMLGSGEWYDILALEENRRYVDGVYFLSDSFWDTDDSTFIRFFDAFVQKMNSRPTRNTLMGYDTAKLLSMLIQGGTTTRDGLARALSSGIFYRGIHSPIVMGSNRVNVAKNVLRYGRGEIIKVDEVILD
jgi:ABC-type branched-subunit amino acid transport system substrate-binding protein